jgi:hypothetical protein
LPTTSTGSTITAMLPYNAQVTPYLKINTTAGQTITMKTDNYHGGGDYNMRSEYITKDGVQEFEGLVWINGHNVQYDMPAGIQILELKYRETGYNAEFTGSFACNDTFYNKLWEKARRTLYVCMRDNYMDCPDRERALWWGDVTILMSQAFYCLDTNAHALTRAAMATLAGWARTNGVLFSPVPGIWGSELPCQSLAAVGPCGFGRYYDYTGDAATIQSVYPAAKKYLLDTWVMEPDGMPYMTGNRGTVWDWGDWGSNIDLRVLTAEWYYMALASAARMAKLSGMAADTALYLARQQILAQNFDRLFWKGNKYMSDVLTTPDERANALAEIAGLASADKWPAIRKIIQTTTYASPYMERWVEEALLQNGDAAGALDRMKTRYTPMVNQADCSTLWEYWSMGSGTYNHSWAGGPLTLLSQYCAGIYPEQPGYAKIGVRPNMGTLTSVSATVTTVKGAISVSHVNKPDSFVTVLTTPGATTMGVPLRDPVPLYQVYVNNTLVWENETFLGGVGGVTLAGKDNGFLNFDMPAVIGNLRPWLPRR